MSYRQAELVVPIKVCARTLLPQPFPHEHCQSFLHNNLIIASGRGKGQKLTHPTQRVTKNVHLFDPMQILKSHGKVNLGHILPWGGCRSPMDACRNFRVILVLSPHPTP
jgi:hypothetical protein